MVILILNCSTGTILQQKRHILLTILWKCRVVSRGSYCAIINRTFYHKVKIYDFLKKSLVTIKLNFLSFIDPFFKTVGH